MILSHFKDIFSSRFLVFPGREAPQHPVAPSFIVLFAFKASQPNGISAVQPCISNYP